MFLESLNRIQEDLESALEQIWDVLANLEERAGLVNGSDANVMP
jgi:hypothetical protein